MRWHSSSYYIFTKASHQKGYQQRANHSCAYYNIYKKLLIRKVINNALTTHAPTIYLTKSHFRANHSSAYYIPTKSSRQKGYQQHADHSCSYYIPNKKSCQSQPFERLLYLQKAHVRKVINNALTTCVPTIIPTKSFSSERLSTMRWHSSSYNIFTKAHLRKVINNALTTHAPTIYLTKSHVTANHSSAYYTYKKLTSERLSTTS